MVEKHKCPVCENPIELTEGAKEGKRVTCPNCFAQLAWHKHKGKFFLACPTCKEAAFDPMNCEECDRRIEKRKLLEEGRL
jgi:hypothetical protein